MTYRAFGGLKGLTFGNNRTLSTAYDIRMRPTTWNVVGVLGYNYNYDHFQELTGRVSYAKSILDSKLDRSYEYDQVGRLIISHSGKEAEAHAYSGQWGTMDGPYSQGYEYDVWGNTTRRYGWGGLLGGAPGSNNEHTATFANNKRNGFTYDLAGNLTNDLGQTFTYDATGQQASAAYSGYSLQQTYDGDRMRVKKVENGVTQYYLRSSVFGGQVVAEINASGVWTRGYVYGARGGLLAVQQTNTVFWVHEDPVTKSKRNTDTAGNITSTIELDPWGGDTGSFSNNRWQQRRMFTSYERDLNDSDEAMHRRYNRWHSRFDQPDPYDGSYSLTDPQSFNRYAYVQNDPVNFVDPSGLNIDVIRTFTWDWPYGFSAQYGFDSGDTGRRGPPDIDPGDGGDTRPDPPQNTGPQKSFGDCAKQAGVAGTGLTEAAANLINDINGNEGTARDLLAVTLMNESSFNLGQAPNTNRSSDVNDWDIGPFQLNVTATASIIAEGGMNLNGLRNPWGLTAAANQPFTGDPLDNGRLAARTLNYHGGGIRAAGLFTGGTRVAERRKSYKKWAPKFRAFFDCFR